MTIRLCTVTTAPAKAPGTAGGAGREPGVRG
jgi:hypothetical protein